MGRHVLRGEFPVFYYGQRYMGGLEPHLAALGFAIGGATPLVLKLVCLAVALVLVWLTAELGRRILGPGPGLVAGVFMALPPIFLTVWSVKARGGFIETLVLGWLVLLLAHRRSRRPGGAACGPPWSSGWSEVSGGGPASSSCPTSRRRVSSSSAAPDGAAGLRVLPLVAGAFVLGSLPMWLDGVAGAARGGVPRGRRSIRRRPRASCTTWSRSGCPALLGPAGRWPASSAIEALTPPRPRRSTRLAWLALLWARVRAWRGGPEPLPRPAPRWTPIVALPVMAVLVCALSRVGWFVSEPRYLLPVAAVVPHPGGRAARDASGAPGWPLAGDHPRRWQLSAVNLAGHVLAPWIAPREAPRSLRAGAGVLRGPADPGRRHHLLDRPAPDVRERRAGRGRADARTRPDRYPP